MSLLKEILIIIVKIKHVHTKVKEIKMYKINNKHKMRLYRQ